MGLLYYVSYLAVVAAFAFVTLSLASGLLYVSELIEEHSRLAKLVGQRSIYVIIVLHAVFYFTDDLPLLHTVFSVLCHIVYLQNFSATWPLISLTSVSFLASCALVIADHFMWFFYFARLTNEARHTRTYQGLYSNPPGFTEIASFFGICVWFTPLFLFLSLSANDNALPTTSGEPASPMTASTPINTAPRVSLIRSIYSFLPLDSVLPRRRNAAEGILAPRTPVAPPMSPLPHRPSSPAMRFQAYPSAPPRSPGPDANYPSMSRTSSEFRLNKTPRQMSREGSYDALGLGPGLSVRRSGSGSGHGKDE